ncbi:MAG: YggS family pyridoxal phosphate-dependent enzyme [Promethearchaeota archaeon]
MKDRLRGLNIPKNVKLVAMSKRKPAKLIKMAYQAGQRCFGENYIQEGIQKIDELRDLEDIEWHFAGHLQSNKAHLAAKYFDLIETVDSVKVARKLNESCKQLNKILPILIQVNIGREPQKHGIDPAIIENFIHNLSGFPNLKIIGLMCIHPKSDHPETYFSTMKTIFDNLKDQYNLTELSMGMSHDYILAIKKGATIVRIGTKIFGPRT